MAGWRLPGRNDLILIGVGALILIAGIVLLGQLRGILRTDPYDIAQEACPFITRVPARDSLSRMRILTNAGLSPQQAAQANEAYEGIYWTSPDYRPANLVCTTAIAAALGDGQLMERETIENWRRWALLKQHYDDAEERRLRQSLDRAEESLRRLDRTKCESTPSLC